MSVPEPGPERTTLLFVTAQRLLAETLGALFTADRSWSLQVVAVDHPDLLDTCRATRPSVVVVDLDDDVLPRLDLVANLVTAVPDAGVVVLAGSVEALPEAIARGARVLDVRRVAG